ncbi:MAG: ParB N-terminal domain-containing protein [Tatlockia sp.]|jgi:hypothetical protein
MTITKNRISAKPKSATHSINKPSTITRAAITADIKLTRGKQLVEHNPFFLIPDPGNPRPGELINESWLKQHLHLGSDKSLCFYDESKREYLIPAFNEINLIDTKVKEEDYNFLRDLAFSIRSEGLIEPIEIFLADKENDPEYFKDNDLTYGYVVLEGHQRRLAAMMASVATVTCIEITDETTLARLKVNHRKLRRQLSENNLRKNLTVSQNFQIIRELLKNPDFNALTAKHISSIVGLNEDIVGCIKKICLQEYEFPSEFIQLIIDNGVTFKWIRKWASKSKNEILQEISRITSGDMINEPIIKEDRPKPRGKKGGAVKRSATFKVQKESDSIILQHFLLTRFPELEIHLDSSSPFANLEKVLENLLDCARSSSIRPGSDLM